MVESEYSIDNYKLKFLPDHLKTLKKCAKITICNEICF